MASYSELFATMNGRERDCLECGVCGESNSSVSCLRDPNDGTLALCYDCHELAETAAALAEDAEAELVELAACRLSDMIVVRRGAFGARLERAGRQQGELNFQEVA